MVIEQRPSLPTRPPASPVTYPRQDCGVTHWVPGQVPVRLERFDQVFLLVFSYAPADRIMSS